jgi:signal transduction histidine kinase
MGFLTQKLDSKMRLYFSMVLLLTLALFLSSHFIFQSVLESKETLINTHFARLLELKDLEILLGREVARNRAYVINGDAQYLREGRQARDEFADHLEKVKALAANNPQSLMLISQIESARFRFMKSEDRLLATPRNAPQMLKLASTWVDEVKPMREAISNAVTAAVDYEASEFNRARAALDFRVRGGTIFFIAAGVITLLFGAIFFWLFYRALLQIRKGVDDLNNQKDKLERSNKELEQFAGVAAHDLRAPLKTMRGWLDILDVSLPKPRTSEVETAMNFVIANTKKSCALVEDLLAVARINVNHVAMEEVNLNDSLQNILKVFKTEIEAAGALISCETLPWVLGNANHLELVFSNLIRNALTYRAKDQRPNIRVGGRRIPGGYEFFVKDNGIGIKPEYQSKIFQMFTRLHSDSEYPGTGIGLAFCKKVVELYGGRIWVNSVPGKGSSFYFTYFTPVIKEEGHEARYYDSR